MSPHPRLGIVHPSHPRRLGTLHPSHPRRLGTLHPSHPRLGTLHPSHPRLGEASGAALALPMLRAAAAVVGEMGTLQEALALG